MHGGSCGHIGRHSFFSSSARASHPRRTAGGTHQVSEVAKSLDADVESFRTRPLDASPYRYLWIDA